MVTNPHFKHVYNAYYHAFRILLDQKQVTSMKENDELSKLLRRLVDEHSEYK